MILVITAEPLTAMAQSFALLPDRFTARLTASATRSVSVMLPSLIAPSGTCSTANASTR